MAAKDEYKIDKNDFLGGFQEVFDMNNENQTSSATNTSTEINNTNTTPTSNPDDEVKTVSPEFFEQNENDESENNELDDEKETKNKSTEESEEEESSKETTKEEGEEESEEEENSSNKSDEESRTDSENEEDDSGVDEDEQDEETIVDSFFDLFVQELGWDYEEGDKPKTIQDLVGFMDNLIQSSSKPQFANEEVQQLNDFVANGGSLDDFVEKYSEYNDVANMDISEDEEAQKKVIRNQLNKLGLSEEIIEKRIERYEDTGILRDEAEESQELLKKYNEKEKEKLLKEQENQRKRREEEQQKFVNDVKSTIDEYKDIKGIPLTKQQKEDLKKYLFEVGSDGKTQYQKDFSQSYHKLIEAAFFTKEGDSILKKLQKRAGSDATKTLKNKLNKRTTKRSKNQTSGSSSSSSTLDMISTISKNLSN